MWCLPLHLYNRAQESEPPPHPVPLPIGWGEGEPRAGRIGTTNIVKPLLKHYTSKESAVDGAIPVLFHAERAWRAASEMASLSIQLKVSRTVLRECGRGNRSHLPRPPGGTLLEAPAPRRT